MLGFALAYPRFEKDRKFIIDHLIALSKEDRFFRFGMHHVNDEIIKKYVNGIKPMDSVICAFNHTITDKPVGLLHIAYSGSGETSSAEIGFSVLPEFRKQGIGTQLFERAITKCQNRVVDHIYTYYVPSNVPVQKMLLRLGFVISRDFDQNTGELKLPNPNMFSFYKGAVHFEQELFGASFANIVRLLKK